MQKKILDVLNESFFSNLVGVGHSFFNSCLGDLLKKSFGKQEIDRCMRWVEMWVFVMLWLRS